MADLISQLRSLHGPFAMIEVEVSSAADLDGILSSKPDIIMLDNFSPETCATLAMHSKAACSSVLIEASGGIDDSNIHSYFHDSIDIISSGWLTTTHSILDFSLKFEKFGPFIH